MISLTSWFREPRLRSTAISVHGIGIREEMLPCRVERPRGTGDYLFMVFHDEITIGEAAAVTTHPAGTLILWEPGDGHFYGNLQRKWRHSWVHCDGKAVRKILQEIGLPFRQPMGLTDPSRCDKYFFDLYEEMNVRDTADPIIARNVVENWLREVHRQVSAPRDRAAVPAEFVSIKTFLESHSSDQLSLTELAERAGLSVPHFCAKFKQLFGVPPIAYLLRLRLHRAASLLRDTTLSVTEISRRVGYRDVFYFSRHFKRQFGISPKRLRAAPSHRLASLQG